MNNVVSHKEDILLWMDQGWIPRRQKSHRWYTCNTVSNGSQEPVLRSIHIGRPRHCTAGM